MGFVRPTAARVRQGSGYLEHVIAIAAGYDHSCAVKASGSVWCWGGGALGQLGDGLSGAGHHRTKAVRVRRGSGYLTKANGVAAGGYHTCVRRTDGTAWCWGYGQAGQLGDGEAGLHIGTKATRVLRGSGHLTGVTAIGSGSYHTCARRSDASAWCWGNADHGQLGDGTTGDPTDHARLKAVRVRRSTGTFTGVRTLEGGVDHTCAVRTDRTLWCWGSNGSAEHGRGTFDDDPHPYPRRVTVP
jgi:alpha-tubulin suppressor-like RCC1 family protein